MAKVSLVEPYAIRSARKSVQESMQMVGEEVIGLHMFHAGRDDGAQRCVRCFDDVYGQSDSYQCDICLGTTFQGGIKEMGRMWAVFDDAINTEKYAKRGIYQPEDRAVQLEWQPHLIENDFVVRVARWSHDHTPLEFVGIYTLDSVNITSLRTGNQVVQTEADRIAQQARARLLDEQHVIYNVLTSKRISTTFPVDRADGFQR